MRLTKLIAVVTAALIGAATFSTSAWASASVRSDQESQMVGQINEHRSSIGAGSLSVHSGLLDVARRQSVRMANDQRIYHNPNLYNDVSAVLPGWKIVGENVGTGMSAESVEQLFLQSSAHRSNIENPNFTLVAVGAMEGADGMLYFTQIFAQPGTPKSSSAPAPAPAAPKAPAPAPPAPAAPAVSKAAPSTNATPRTTSASTAATVKQVVTPVPTAEPAVHPEATAPEAEPVVTTVRGSTHEAPPSALQRVVAGLRAAAEVLWGLFSQPTMLR